MPGKCYANFCAITHVERNQELTLNCVVNDMAMTRVETLLMEMELAENQSMDALLMMRTLTLLMVDQV